MKKLFLFLAFSGILILPGCEGPQGPPGPQGADGFNVEAEVIQLSNVNFTAAGSYGIFYDLVPAILSSDMILVYRQSGVDGGPVWQLMPQTYYPVQGEIDFNYDFTMNDINIFLDSTYDLALTPQYTQGQNFRIVIIPGYFSKFGLEKMDYDSVIQKLGIKEENIRQIQY